MQVTHCITLRDALVLETLHSQILAACVHWTFMIGESAHQLGATISGGTRENVEAQCNAVSSSHISRVSWILRAIQPALVTIVEFPYLIILLEYCRLKKLRFSGRVLWKKLKAAPIKTLSGDQMQGKLAIEYLEPFSHINTVNTYLHFQYIMKTYENRVVPHFSCRHSMIQDIAK